MNRSLPLCLLTVSSFLHCISDLDALVISPNECFMVVLFGIVCNRLHPLLYQVNLLPTNS